MAKKPTSGPGFQTPCKKIDVHIHLAKPGVPGGSFNAEERIEFDKFMGIEKCVILPTNPGKAPSPVIPEAMLGMMLSSEDACEIANKYPDHYVWLCNVHPENDPEVYEKLKRYKEMGAKGVGEMVSVKWFDDPDFDYFMSCCEELDLPILFHMCPAGMQNYGVLDEAGLPQLERALQRHPNLKFIGHSQPFWFEISEYPADLTAEERNIYPKGKVIPGRLPYLLEKYPNLYADLSADSGGNALLRDEEYAIEFLNKFQDKLLYGSDIVNANFIYPLGFYLDSLLHQLKISEEVYEKVCSGNAKKLLGI